MKSLLCCLFAAFLFICESSTPAAVFTSELIANLPSTTGASFSSSPSAGVQGGKYFYFAASDGPGGTTGRELWRTDGTTAGTTLVKDIRPGPADSTPEYLTAAGTNLFFFADDGAHGKGLWRSDGTAAGTILLVNASSWSSNFVGVAMKPAGNWVYLITSVFVSGGGGIFDFGFEDTLYRSDGTVMGTVKLSGPGGSVTTNTVGHLDVTGTDAIFVEVNHPGSSTVRPTNTIWHFSGGGPYFAFPLDTLSESIEDLRVAGTNCYFLVSSNYVDRQQFTTNNYYQDRLLRHSLSTSGASQQVEVSPRHLEYSWLNLLGTWNGRLFYEVYQKDYYQAPAAFLAMKAVNGSAAPVVVQGAGSDFPSVLGQVGANVYYQLGTTRVMRTDGTSAGTLAFDFSSAGMTPYDYFQAGTRFYFVDGGTFELGVTDFTLAGTHLIDSVPGTNQLGVQIRGTLGNLAIYAADDGVIGIEPYRTDGTTNGTMLLKDIAAGADTTPPLEAIASGGLYYFTFDSPGIGVELWKSDGTGPGTALVKDIRPGTNSSGAAHLTAWNGLVYFTANDGTNGSELWRSNGTAGGTFMVKDGRFGPAGSNPPQLTPAGALMFFVADDGSHGAELWRTDGTADGTYMIQDIVAGVGSANIRSLGAANGVAYFVAGPAATSGQLWLSYGQPGGTQFLKDLGTLSDPSYAPRQFTAFGGFVYFSTGPFNFPTLWRTDQTPEGTTAIQNGVGNEIRVAGSNLLLSGPASLWKSDLANPTPVPLTNLVNFGFVSQLTSFDSQVYFGVGEDLWSSDGTTNGTIRVADFPASGTTVSNLVPLLGTLVFTASTPTFGREPWSVVPGQTATLIEDLNPQSASAGASFLTAISNRIYYVARPGGNFTGRYERSHCRI